jgi:hypothetical protein
MDGVIIPNTFEDLLFERIREHGHTFEDSDSIWDWYIRMVSESAPLALNHSLLSALSDLKDRGNIIKLWTNRNIDLRVPTISNLDVYASIFDSFQFCNGLKSTMQVEGIVLDNSPQYLKCGELGGILVNF